MTKINNSIKEAVIEMYRRGFPTKKIAHWNGISDTYVCQIAHKAGMRRRNYRYAPKRTGGRAVKKVSIYLYVEDINFAKTLEEFGFHNWIRTAIHAKVRECKQMEKQNESQRDSRKDLAGPLGTLPTPYSPVD